MALIQLETKDYQQALEQRLEFEIKLLREEGLKADLKKEDQGELLVFYFKLGAASELWSLTKESVANVISDLIINQLEIKLVSSILKTYYQEFNVFERQTILAYIYERLDLKQNGQQQSIASAVERKNKIAAKIIDYLESETSLNLEGFLEFRLTDYKQSLKRTVEEAVDEYLLEQEYQEFIDLLADIVQEESIARPVINIVRINDTNFRLIREYSQESSEQIRSGDQLINTLISLAPQEIILHFKEPSSVVEMLENIFPKRISSCSGCKYCQLDEFK